MADDISSYVHGIRANIGQFAQQLLQVFFVGLTIGMQRTVVPALAEVEFGMLEAGFWFTAVAMFLSGAWVAFAMEETLSRINPAPNPDQGTQNAE